MRTRRHSPASNPLWHILSIWVLAKANPLPVNLRR